MIRDIDEPVEPARPEPPPPPPAPERPPAAGLRRGTALLVVVAALVSGITGGLIGSGLERMAAPAGAGGTAASDVRAAVDAVLPAVVIIESLDESGIPLTSGSGLIIDREMGIIVTNSHVVEQQRSIDPVQRLAVTTAVGRTYPAEVIGLDPFTDVALVKVEVVLSAEARLAPEAEIRLGEAVIAIGSPGYGSGREAGILSNTVTSGVVSGLERSLPRPDLRDVYLSGLIQTDAPINTGMSGGPLVKVATREVIGLNTLVLRSTGEEGLGFAVTASQVVAIAEELLASGQIVRGSLGIGFRESDSPVSFAGAGRQGALVTAVPAGSPGAAAGLQSGDLILAVNGEDIVPGRPLRSMLLDFKPGEVVQLTVLRDGEQYLVDVTLGEDG